MILLNPSTSGDIQRIVEWTKHDPYHYHQDEPEWWLTQAPGSLLAFCLIDEVGPVVYVRFDAEGDYVRIHTQFAPEEVVSKRRLVAGMIECLDKLIQFFNPVAKGFIFNSISPSLIAFMEKKFRFKAVGNDDYRMDFEE